MANERKFPTGINLSGQKAVNAGDPSSASDLATKAYVDNYVIGNSWKDGVKAATTTNITLSGTQTVDTISLGVDDSCLVMNQTTGSENGIYLVKSGSWVRRFDLPTGADARGIVVPVEQGSANDDKNFVCTADPAVVGTDALTFTAMGTGGTYTAGDGLQESPAGTFKVKLDTNPGLSVGASGLKALLNGSTLTLGASGLSVTTPYSPAAVDSSAGTSTSITHGMGTADIGVQVRDTSTNEILTPGITITSTTIVVSHGSSLSAGAWRIIYWKVA